MARSFTEAYEIGNAINRGLWALKTAPIVLLAGAVLDQCSQGCGSNMGNITSRSDSPAWTGDWSESLERLDSYAGPGLLLVILLAALCVMFALVLLFFVRCWIQSGYIRLQQEILSSGKGRFSTLLASTQVFWPMVKWKTLKGFVFFGTLTISALPGGLVALMGYPGHSLALMVGGGFLAALLAIPVAIYVGLGLFFGDWLVAIDGVRSTTALDKSWEMARGRRLHLFLFSLTMALFSILGMVALCIGVFFTKSVADSGSTAAFLLLTRDEDQLSRYACLLKDSTQEPLGSVD